MAQILERFPYADRAKAHELQARVRKDGSAPAATCTESADEVIVWDDQPTTDDVDAANPTTSAGGDA